MTDSNPRSHRSSYYGKECNAISDDNTNMSPPVWQQLWNRKCGQLAISSSEADHRMSYNGLANVMGCRAYDSSNENKNVACQDEPSTAEQVAISTADHEGDCHSGDVHRSDPVEVSQDYRRTMELSGPLPCAICCRRTKGSSDLELDSAEERDRPERNAI